MLTKWRKRFKQADILPLKSVLQAATEHAEPIQKMPKAYMTPRTMLAVLNAPSAASIAEGQCRLFSVMPAGRARPTISVGLNLNTAVWFKQVVAGISG